MTTETTIQDEPEPLDAYENGSPSEESQAPIQNLRDGPITAAIWRNEREEGLPYYAVTLSRSYRDEDGQWREARSFIGLDVLAAGKLLENAYERIRHFRDQDRRRQRAIAQTANGRDGR
ncbi:MAG: hypothetical protein AAF711_01150 [Planctomycetota bacterium]